MVDATKQLNIKNDAIEPKDMMIIVLQRIKYYLARFFSKLFSLLKSNTKRLDERVSTEFSHFQEKLKVIDIKMNKIEENMRNKVSDEFYSDFENYFRGDEASIKLKQAFYWQELSSHYSNAGELVFVDIGCGRGEWLDILRESGVKRFSGCDLNKIFVDYCYNKGHNVACLDCCECLSTFGNESIDVITGFQIAEHLTFDKLLDLFIASYNALTKGGILILETPNPNNIITSSTNFFTDLSHVHPLRPMLMEFLARRAGFSDIQIIGRNPVERSIASVSDVEFGLDVDFLNQILFGSQDYAIWAVK